MAAFALSCFGILLYLWTTFGGPIPFKPHGYRVKVSLPQASALTQESDVRISGINVGKVKAVELVNSRAQITAEIDSKYAPVASNSRAIRRGKTLLNEAYLELTRGSPSAPTVPDGGKLAVSQAAESVDLDQILATFDPQTRRAMQTWFGQMAVSVSGRGYELNSAIGNFATLTENLNQFVEILNRDQEAVGLLVKNGAQAFSALSRNGDQLASLVRNSNRIFSATARSSQQLARAITLFPTFLDETKKTAVRVRQFGDRNDKTIQKVTGLAEDLQPTLTYANQLAPDFNRLFTGLGPLFDASVKGVPATNSVLDSVRTLSAQLYPWLLEVNPILAWVAQYPRETTAFLGNLAAVTNAADNPAGAVYPTHYLRATPTLSADSYAAYSNRLQSNRSNSYQRFGANDLLANGLQVFDSATNCTSNSVPTVSETSPSELKTLMDQYVFSLLPAATVRCAQQEPFTFQGRTSEFPHVEADADKR